MLIPFDQLFARHHIKAKGVLHLGANTGQEAETYDKLGIKRVIWVEALLDIYHDLWTSVKKYPGHVALCACLGERNGDEVTFRRANNGSQSSSYLEFGTHARSYPGTVFVEEIKMRTVRLDTLLFEHKLEIETGWFLNIDVQGAELQVLRGMGDLLYCFGWAYIEVNDREVYKGCALVHEIDEYLFKYGFVRKETKWMGTAGWGDSIFVRE